MRKKFLSNLLLLVLLNLLIKPFWFFGIEVAVQNRVGEEMYGFYFSLFNFAFILNILLDIGITNFNNRSIARDHSLLKIHLSDIVPLKLLLSILYASIVFLLGWIIGYSNVQFRLLVILVINQFLSSFILYLRSNISGMQLFRTDSLLSVLDRSLMILMNAVLLWSGITGKTYRIEWFVYTQTFSYLVTGMVAGIIVRKHSGRVRIQFSFRNFRSILVQSYPFALLILLMSFFNRADSVMIERMLTDGKEQAGIYAQSYRIMDAFSQFALLFAGLLLPMFSRMLKTGEKISGLIYDASSLLLGASLTIALLAVFFNKEVIELLYHSIDPSSPKIFSLLMGGFVFISVSYIYGTLLTANRNLLHLNILAGITVVLNIVLNLILIPVYKAYGAALASIFSQGFYALSQLVLAHRTLQLKYDVAFYLKLLLYVTLLGVTGYLLHNYLEWLPALLLFLGSALMLILITRIIRPREILNIFREE